MNLICNILLFVIVLHKKVRSFTENALSCLYGSFLDLVSEDFILAADREARTVYQISTSSGKPQHIPVTIVNIDTNTQIVYDPLTQYVYWNDQDVDGSKSYIKRMNLTVNVTADIFLELPQGGFLLAAAICTAWFSSPCSTL